MIFAALFGVLLILVITMLLSFVGWLFLNGFDFLYDFFNNAVK